MRIGKVIGTVTPGTLHPSLVGGQLKIVVPFTFNDLISSNEEKSTEETSEKFRVRCSGTELVVYDELSAGLGEWVAFSEGAEASMPFYPNNKPIDAYIGAILDTVEIDEQAIQRLLNH